MNCLLFLFLFLAGSCSRSVFSNSKAGTSPSQGKESSDQNQKKVVPLEKAEAPKVPSDESCKLSIEGPPIGANIAKFAIAATEKFTVPEGVKCVHVKVWGAGGGGANRTISLGQSNPSNFDCASGTGGAGAFVASILQVKAGEVLNLEIGRAGYQGCCGYCRSWNGIIVGSSGAAGGKSSQIKSSEGTLLIAAGGGGGGNICPRGSYANSTYIKAGKPATLAVQNIFDGSAGGVGVDDSLNTPPTAENCGIGGIGGGSFLQADSTGVAPNDHQAPKNDDPDYVQGVASGGLNTPNAGNGLIVIRW